MTATLAELVMTRVLTPGMARDLERYRAWEEGHGHPPTPREWATLYRMSVPAADAALMRLAAAGFTGPRRAYRVDDRGTGPSAAELECRRLIAMLGAADVLFSIISVGDRPARDEWRRQAADYLRRNQTGSTAAC